MYETGTMEWFENVLPMWNPSKISLKEYLAMADAIEIQHEEAALGEDLLDCYIATPILDANYKKVDIEDVAKMQTHLTLTQRNKLAEVLAKHKNYSMEPWVCIPIRNSTSM